MILCANHGGSFVSHSLVGQRVPKVLQRQVLLDRRLLNALADLFADARPILAGDFKRILLRSQA